MNIDSKESRRERLAALLIEKSYREGDFTLTSGRKSDYYFDCKQTALHPEGGYLLGKLLLAEVLAMGESIHGVGGMTLGADPLVSAVSVLSHAEVLAGRVNARPLPAFIVRKKPKGHGTDQYLEGLANFPTGAPVVMLEDVVTTGGTLLTACERVAAAGLRVAGIVSVLDRQEGGAEAIAQAGYHLVSLFTRSSLLKAAGRG
ncbi:orotate phosphoribosyltransferase [Oceanidesulfovibrio marinus]|uniref:Orotate phosphoribosyltransferase n=1 Tax=Oceanidesulfovibrio marinus TaxID=370038 RepID=A0A6P1ZJH1_9BACT|nr:orotate phosphoribosyltransferase [Oceanidesulfovibrio marinus]QJT10190.1 orotate phosphoribosyltransferase [Oceanidesulfovibrio marinus]TVM35696.1 orotate phosphoribosyltransferase [Oceanidesulfovibrio marinus]